VVSDGLSRKITAAAAHGQSHKQQSGALTASTWAMYLEFSAKKIFAEYRYIWVINYNISLT
jgi:hypothetical protein